MKIVYICSPCRAETRSEMEKNIERAVGYCRAAVERGVIPIAPHAYFTQFMDDMIPEERKTALQMGRKLLTLCSEVWVSDMKNPSAGMKAEISLARQLGISVIDAADIFAGRTL